MTTPATFESATDCLRATLFGGLSISTERLPITHFRSQKVGALLAYLLLHPGANHRREYLRELLFPDAEVESAQNAFRVTLHRLRSLLTSPTGGPGENLLTVDGQQIRLHGELVLSDVSLFASAMRSPKAIENLQPAVDLYTGSLLTGYDDLWIEPYRQRFEEQYLDALRRLVRLLSERQDFEQALIYTLRALATNPYQDESHLAALNLYLQMGRPAAAWKHVQDYEQRLREELNCDLPAALWAIKDRIRQTLSLASSKDIASPLKPVVLIADMAHGGGGGASSPNRFFGREEETRTLIGLLLEERQRLVCITGPAGIGKTRLAQEIARQVAGAFDASICEVALDAAANGEQAVGKLSDALKRAFGIGAGDSLDGLLTALSHHPSSLLVLDNLEHLLEPQSDPAGNADPSRNITDLIEAILAACPDVTILATSRRRLNLLTEQEFLLMPLPVPLGHPNGKQGERLPSGSDFAEIARSPSVQLLVDRMRRFRPDFVLRESNILSVSRLCQLLEGIPLAIELAATWASTLSPGQMVTRLGGRPDLLCAEIRGVPARHRTLWTALDGSYRLLSPELQRLFIRLSVFRGGWTVEAATAICAEEGATTEDVLRSLRELQTRSLVLRPDTDAGEEADTADDMHFRLLEAIRAFAWGLLTAEEQADLQVRHANHFKDWAISRNKEYGKGNAEAYLPAIAREYDNLRCVLDRVLSEDSPIPVHTGLHVARATCDYWTLHGPISEARRYIRSLLALPGASPSLERAALEMLSGYHAYIQGDFSEAWRLEEACVATCHLINETKPLIGAYNVLCSLHQRESGVEAGRPYIEKSIAIVRERGDPPGHLLSPLTALGLLEDKAGNVHAARACYEECLTISRQTQNTQWIISSLVALAGVDIRLEEFTTAENRVIDAFALLRGFDIPNLRANAHVLYGNLFFAQERHFEATPEYRSALKVFREIEQTFRLIQCLWHLCHVYAKQGVPMTAARLLGTVDSYLDRQGDGADGGKLREQERDATARAEIQAALSESAFRNAYHEGRALSPEEAADWILSLETPTQ